MRIATYDGGPVKIWDGSGNEVVTLVIKHALNHLHYCADGKTIVTGGIDKVVRSWDVGTGKELLNFSSTAEITYLVCSTVGSKVAIASGGKLVCVWDARSDEVFPIEGKSHDRTGVSFDSEGGRLITCDGTETVRIWDFVKKLKTEMKVAEMIRSAVFSPDGSSVAVIPTQGNRVRLINAATGKEYIILETKDTIISVGFNETGSKIITLSLNSIQVWDGRNGRSCFDAALDEDGYHFMKISGNRILTWTNSLDGKIRVRNIENGNLLRSYRTHHHRFIIVRSKPYHERFGRWIGQNMGCEWRS